ncbi:hypothetical protein AB6A40_005880 [Gnathostoma spinigerum]|uniref:Dual specificity protein phosphatase 22 n=1 Tax=Gnathostoma spinigerum TaxID=75299 RepID=A0ABD6EIT6_9BILA
MFQYVTHLRETKKALFMHIIHVYEVVLIVGYKKGDTIFFHLLESMNEERREELKRLTHVVEKWRNRRCYGMSEILPRLFVGNLGDSVDKAQLTANNITDILSIHDLSRENPLHNSFNVLRLHLSDRPEANISELFSQSNAFIHSARLKNRSVLVHCLAGASRSVCLVAAYIIAVTDMGYASAIAFIAEKRPCACPNFGFRMQLAKYADKIVVQERERLQKLFDEESNVKQRVEDLSAVYHLTSILPKCPIRGSSKRIEASSAQHRSFHDQMNSDRDERIPSRMSEDGWDAVGILSTTDSFCAKGAAGKETMLRLRICLQFDEMFDPVIVMMKIA